MSRLDEFRAMVDSIDDKTLLSSGIDLLRDMAKISKLKREIEDLESSLTEGGRSVFYFFAEELSDDEIIFAAERISGRIKRLDRLEKKR
jgi:hypothetical protein|tara:strand:- start:54 stop:320 length:267 start_codon:yes stop_codon:yes gene_type:complete